MEDKNHNQFVDELLDAGLARYSNVTPRPGLEGRILANARAAQEQSPWFVWTSWLASGAVAAAIVVGVLALTHLRTPPPPPVAAIKREGMVTGPRAEAGPAKPNLARQRTPALLAQHVARPKTEPAAAEPRLAQFPSPRPLSDQEKLLIEYVRHTSAGILSASATEDTDIPELEIKELEIAPLDAGTTETQPN